MKVKIKLEDYLKNAGIGTIDKEKKARDFEKMVEDALKNAVRGRKTTENGGKTDKPDDDGGKIVENENGENRSFSKNALSAVRSDLKNQCRECFFRGGGFSIICCLPFIFISSSLKSFTPYPNRI